MRTYIQVAFGAAATFALFLCLPYVLQSASDKPSQADAIVILGGGGVERTLTAYELSREGHSQKFLLTGAEEGQGGSGNKISDARVKWLTFNGVPIQNIYFVDQSFNSWLEAQRTLEVMKQKHWEKVLVISDPPHMLRLRYSWGKTFFGEDQHYALIATRPKWWTPWEWWENRSSASFIRNEVFKLIYYILRY